MGMEKHGCPKDKTRFCFFDMGVRHACAVKPWTTIHGRGTLCHHREARRPRSHPQRDVGDRVLPELFQILRARPLTIGCCIDWAAVEQVQLADALRALLSTDPWEWFFAITEPTYLELALELCSTFHLQVVMTINDDPIHAMSVPEFGVALELYTNEFMEEEDMNTLPRNIHISPSLCCKALAPLSSTYDPSRSKASALAPSLRYLHAIHSPSDRAASEGSNLYRPLRDTPCQTLRPPQHRGPVISAYTARSDVLTRHHDYVTHKDDRAPMWDRSSSVPSHSCH
ncbi:hypothetical protein GOBAR_AA27567 [Gossypium barbadense]|uniref:Uncharacterized protein n=1 Tax=Gossypium barbadense TaxID=3634 RepID=A0A2P5WPU1_GOSBA|nr:hypothetical protein GOBAR_AA27567 [Gossypium barbadense]